MPSKPNDFAVLDEIARLFAERGDSMYVGEPVTQTEHALQCAWQAEQQEAGDAMIAAALLHDIGHLLHEFDGDCAEQGIDDQHEQIGATWLQARFAPDVCEPVKLHVMAKRYRCAVDKEYWARLSSASQLSLKLQGGSLSATEADQFRSHPHFRFALQLRHWDEAAKVPQLQTPTLAHFLTFVERVLESSA